MFPESIFITIACIMSFSLVTDVYTVPPENIAIGICTTWALTYGILAARKLRTTQEAIDHLEAQVKSQSHRNDMKFADICKRIHENHSVMMELRTRLILVQQYMNKHATQHNA